MAGAIGIDPRPFTFFELREMFVSHQYWQHHHTLHLVAAMAAAFGGTRLDPTELNPYREEFLGEHIPKQTVGPKELYQMLTEHAESKHGRYR